MDEENISIEKILNMGPGWTLPTAYDTAWVASLGDLAPDISNRALNWLCEHQLSDGSWGAEEPNYYYDRVLSTLAAMIALKRSGWSSGIRKQIQDGKSALDRITSKNNQGLTPGVNGATAGFEMIVPTLVSDAERLGILTEQQGRKIVGQLDAHRQKKMAAINRQRINRHYTLAFSAEMAGNDWLNAFDLDDLREEDGSVAHSPSATAYYVSIIQNNDQRALDYLRRASSPDGGAYIAVPFDIYEIAWVLWNFSLVNGASCNNNFQKYIVYLREAWNCKYGVGFASIHSVADGDDTAMVASLLARFDGGVDLKTLAYYVEEDHYRCFPLEVDYSISTNVHFLAALRNIGNPVDHPDIQRILHFLDKSKVMDTYWFDKWHVSPYYTTSHAIIASAGYCNKLVEKSVEWLISTQHSDGSWGFYKAPSVEETAYALQALTIWSQFGDSKISPNILRRGAFWLKGHFENPLFPWMWIAKSLNISTWVYLAEIATALMLVQQVI